MNQQIEDTQYLGMENKHSLICLICGALLPSCQEFQSLHMSREHNLII